MDCPACKDVMIVVEHEGIELDYCDDCHGVWFDSGELELLFESLNLKDGVKFDDIMEKPSKESSEKPRPCPMCKKKMDKMASKSDSDFLIDKCASGDGLWFDGGEVGKVIKHLLEKSDVKSDRVVMFLGEVFKNN